MEVTMVFAIGVLIVRLGLLVAGVLFCWFGYRLFAQISSHGNAEITVKDMIKLNLQHVGPGLFFSLFGAAILVYSIYRAPILDARTVGNSSHADATMSLPSGQSSITIAGAKSDTQILDDRARLEQVREQIGFINRLDSTGKLQPDDQLDLARLTREIKLSLMRSIWSASWGDRAEFEAWARGSTTGVPNEEARKFYERL